MTDDVDFLVLLNATQATQSVGIDLKNGMKATFTESYKEHYPVFMMLGTRMNQGKYRDILDVIADLSKPAFKVLNQYFKPNRDEYTNFVVFMPNHKSQSERSNFYKSVKELASMNIIKRVPAAVKPRRKGEVVYMINPDMIIAREYSQAKPVWEKL